ncbi:unnamed protein product [Ectocarpus sp. CCAP 1310/34]|nr:unnamed protein product [Ectocarpus sp. CCAP 1310/34]
MVVLQYWAGRGAGICTHLPNPLTSCVYPPYSRRGTRGLPCGGVIARNASIQCCSAGLLPCTSPPRTATTAAGIDHQPSAGNAGETAPGVLRRNVKGSARTGCPFEVSVRHAKTHRWPKISNMKLKHNHSVDRNAIDVQLRLASKLTEEQLGQVNQMTSHGMKPKEVTKAMKALHEDGDIDINKRAVQNAAATVHGAEKPRDAADAYEEVLAATADGGVCEIKMDDSGRLTHIWWQTREQVALWNRYGHVALYDDTAVKNRYRMPLGVLAVIDSEYRTRIVGQIITADTTTDALLWMLKSALESRGGKQPDIFIQDADAAMTAAVREVFPDALARRCLWHLNQNIIKALAKVLGGDMKPFMDEFRCVRQQLSLAKFERKFNALIEKYPKAEKYMRVVYDDRARWAEYVSPLMFSVGSWTTSRVEGAGRWKSFVGSSQTVQTVLLDLKEKGPTDQDRQVLYADVTKKLGQAASILSDRFSPTVAVALVDQFMTMVNMQAGRVRTTTTGGRGAALFMANPGTLRLPARTSNERRPGAAERYTKRG